MGHTALAPFEDEYAVELAAVAVLQSLLRSDGIVRTRHQKTVLDDDEPIFHAFAVIERQFFVFCAQALRNTLDGKGFYHGGDAGIPKSLLETSGDVENVDRLDF